MPWPRDRLVILDPIVDAAPFIDFPKSNYVQSLTHVIVLPCQRTARPVRMYLTTGSRKKSSTRRCPV